MNALKTHPLFFMLASLLAVTLSCAFPCCSWASNAVEKEAVLITAEITTDSAAGSTDESKTDTSDDVSLKADVGNESMTDLSKDSKDEGASNQSIHEGSASVTTPIKENNSDVAIENSSTASSNNAVIEDIKEKAPLEDGIYVIESANNLQQVLDVTAASSADGSNVQSYVSNTTAAQQWRFTYSSEQGYYSIVNVGSGKALDVAGASMSDGANVQIYTPNDTNAQYWKLVKTATGYKVVSALKGDFVLDIAGGNTASGANVQMYTSNDTLAQRFWFLASAPVVQAIKTIDDGCYTITLANGESYALDIDSASQDNGANVQLYASNGTAVQKFYFTIDDQGFYTIANVSSGKVLDVAGANIVPSTNVQQYVANGTAAQKWSVVLNSDGTYSFVCKANALALDVAGNRAANGTNVWAYTANATAAQKFNLLKAALINEGISSIRTRLDYGYAVDIPACSSAEGVQAQVYEYNASFAQKYSISLLENGNYVFQIVGTGKNLAADATAKVVQLSKDNDSAFQQWSASWMMTGIVLTNVATGKVLDVTGAAVVNGTKMQVYSSNETLAQRFAFVASNLIDDGMYVVSSAVGGKVLDVSGASKSSGANIQVWSENGSNAQKFVINYIGDGYYKIVNARSGNAVDVAGGATVNGANVQQYEYNGTAAQLWKAVISDSGGVVFIGKGSGKALDIQGAGNYDGANVQLYQANQTNTQRWFVNQTQYASEDDVLDRAKATASGYGSDTNFLICVDLSSHRVVVFNGSYGNWGVSQNWICSNGAPSTPTVVGEFTIGSRGYSFGSGYTCYYWTQFYGDYLFHSVLYYEGTDVVMDGTLGEAVSHGCVRLDINDAYWINAYVPSGTKVVTYY